MATGQRTEVLIGRARGWDEKLVTAGSVARASRKILRNCGWALALGRWRVRDGQCAALTALLAIALTLDTPALLAVVSGAVTLSGPPAPPATGRPLASRGTITGLGAGRAEPALASLEEATTAAVRMGAGAGESLTQRGFAGILQRAHGRECSRAASLGGKLQSSSRDALWPSAGLGRGSRTSPAYIASAALARTKTEPPPLSTDRGVAHLALSKWLTS